MTQLKSEIQEKFFNLLDQKLKVCYKDDHDSKCMTVITVGDSPMAERNDGQLENDPYQHDVVAITYHQLPPWVGINDCDPDTADMYTSLMAAAPELFDCLYDLFHFCNGWNLGQENIKEYNDIKEKTEKLLDKIIAEINTI